MHLIKQVLRHQDLEGIHLPSFKFSWKLKKLCRGRNGFTLRFHSGRTRFKNKKIDLTKELLMDGEGNFLGF
jgi:hypothetical protein